jgi:hypothetical protein
MVCKRRKQYDLNYYLFSGLIRVGGRCKHEKILPFSLVKARQRYREERLIPSIIYHQKRDFMDRKASSEVIIQSNETIIEASCSHLTSLGLFKAQNIIKTGHYNSLIGRSGRHRPLNSVLHEWLNLNSTVEMINSIDGEYVQSDIDENQSFSAEDDEEQEEEQRRRDEIDFDELFFHPKKFVSKISRTSTDNKPDDDGWQAVVNKNKQKQIIHQLLTTPTTFDDKKIDMIHKDLWTLTIPERHDLYRYWLNKYREKCHKSVSNAHLEFNQAMAEHSQYLQLEDYYILKNAIIVAMTTTCAAKYFDVLQKLGKKRKNQFFLLVICIRF